jgi:ribonuclease Z
MDHFAGFDRLLRVCLHRMTPLHLIGPAGFADRVEHKLRAYTLNLLDMDSVDFVITAAEFSGTGAVVLARDADQLFIEAPFLDTDANIAAQRRHLTARQAGEIGRRAHAGRVVPFHFSARYLSRADELRREVEEAFRPAEPLG